VRKKICRWKTKMLSLTKSQSRKGTQSGSKRLCRLKPQQAFGNTVPQEAYTKMRLLQVWLDATKMVVVQ
jgi:hypothetical protein